MTNRFTIRVRKPPLSEVAVFCRKLAILLDAGVSLEHSLDMLAAKTANNALARAAARMRSGVLQGRGLSKVMAETGVFPPFLYGLTALGELTAKLPKVMTRLADFYEERARSRGEVRAALMYPAVVTVLMLAVMLLMVIYVMPEYVKVFNASGAEIPGSTRVLLDMSVFVAGNAPLIGCLLLLMFICAYVFIKSKPGRAAADFIKLNAPPFRRIYRLDITLRFTQALELLLSSGQSLHDAMPVCAGLFDNGRVKGDLLRVWAALESGRPFWESVAEIKYLDPLFAGMMQVGEETGRLAATLDKCAEHFQQARTSQLRRFNKLVEPLIMLVLGALMLVLMMSVITPTFSLTETF